MAMQEAMAVVEGAATVARVALAEGRNILGSLNRPGKAMRT